MIEYVSAVMRVEWPAEQRGDVIGDVVRGKQMERGREARYEIGFGEILGQRADRLGLAREVREAGHAVGFERQPVGPQITEIGDNDPDPTTARRIGGDDMVRAPVAQQ